MFIRVAATTDMSVQIGPESLLAEAPQVVTVEGSRYILNELDDGTVVLYSTVCQHQGGRVMVREDVFRCPTHRWEYDPETGECLTEDACLPRTTLRREDGNLVGPLPE
jgi:CMP-N-acetylneuraminate monooxygenase